MDTCRFETKTTALTQSHRVIAEGLEGGGEGWSVFKTNPLFFKMLIDFRQFLYDSVEKVLFKADFFFCMIEMRRQTLAHNLNIHCI